MTEITLDYGHLFCKSVVLFNSLNLIFILYLSTKAQMIFKSLKRLIINDGNQSFLNLLRDILSL